VPSLFTFLGAPVASFVGSSARLDVRCVTAPRRALLTVFRTNPVASFVGSSARVGRFVRHCSSQRFTPLYFGLQQLPGYLAAPSFGVLFADESPFCSRLIETDPFKVAAVPRHYNSGYVSRFLWS
jgi:hypothetical protein